MQSCLWKFPIMVTNMTHIWLNVVGSQVLYIRSCNPLDERNRYRERRAGRVRQGGDRKRGVKSAEKKREREKREVKWKSLSHVWLFATLWTIQSMECSRPEYWNGWPFPSPGELPNPGLPHCTQILYQLSHKGSSRILQSVTYPFSRGSFRPRNWTGVSCIAGRFITNWTIREAKERRGKWKRKDRRWRRQRFCCWQCFVFFFTPILTSSYLRAMVLNISWPRTLFRTWWIFEPLLGEKNAMSFPSPSPDRPHYLFFFKFFSHLGHYRILNRVPCAIQ